MDAKEPRRNWSQASLRDSGRRIRIICRKLDVLVQKLKQCRGIVVVLVALRFSACLFNIVRRHAADDVGLEAKWF